MADTDAEVLFTDVAAWRAWLDENEGTSDGVWLVLARKNKEAPTTLTYDSALDEALCSGWIDAQGRSRDEVTSLQRFCPRRSRSRWSARNVRIVDRLIAEGRMRPRGQQEIDRAKEDGRWDVAYEGSKNIEVPPDLAEALAASPRAAAMFGILTAQNRFAVLFRITGVKKPETRERNIAKFVGMLERGETVYPQKRKLDD
ncbi:YdeI/OmpD-associated family protein [Promicromonospora kroppenstedtii]|uniref:YdeI/OmpD-associated family protein n=1 Tax=Promicromonospora kroppenstedtii TaxID=440482 RepID=UPI0004AF44C5|nr:YdeI/OmpD-associated family protein [Promicromonospora kroppenstedtii]